MNRLQITSETIPEAHRLEAWNDTVPWTTALAPGCKTALGYRASIFSFGDLYLRDVETTAAVHFGMRKKPSREDGLFQLVKMDSGTFKHVVDGDVIEARAGDVLFLRLSELRLSMNDNRRSRALSGPMDLLDFDPARHANVIRFPAGDPYTGVIASALDHMAESFPTDAHASHGRLTAAAQGLVNGLVLNRPRALDDETPIKASARRRAIEDFVSDNLGNPDLGMGFVSVEMRISRATLSRDFEPDGGLATYIRNLRLDRAMAAVTNGVPTRGKVTATAETLGFLDMSQFNRAFRARFGMSPRDAMQL